MILRILLLTFLMPLSFAAQVGIVVNKRAIIYADLERKVPIGFVKKGKQVPVGEVKRRQGELLPINVNGKIAWIETKNLYLPSEDKSFDQNKKITEHEVIIEEKVKDPLNQNNFISLKTGPSQMNLSLISSTQGEVNADLEAGTETTLMFEHRNPHLPYNWGIGVELLSAELDGLYQFQSLSFKGGMAYVPLHLKYINVELYGSVLLSGAFQVESQGIGVYKGNMYGLDLGTKVRLFPASKFGAFIGVGQSYYRIDGLENIENVDDDVSLKLSSISVTKAFAGLSYRF